MSSLILCCAVILFLYKFFTRTFTFWKDKSVKGPEPIPLFGNFLRVAINKDHRSTLAEEIYHQYPGEKIVGIYRLTTPVLLIRDLDIIKHVLIKDFDYFQDRGVEFSKEGLGANLIHSDGDTWNVLRKKLTPIFTPSKLKGMFHLISDRSNQFIKYVDNVIKDGESVEIGSLAAKFTGEVIGACAFGVEINAFNDEFNKYMDIGNKQLTPTFRMKLNMLFPSILKILNMDMFSKEIRDHYNNLVQNIVRERDGKKKSRRDFMDLLIEMKEQGTIKGNKVRSKDNIDLEMTETLMAAQAFAFFGAGFETSSVVMTLMLYELALNPDIQDKLIKEIVEIIENHEGAITYDAVSEMSYLDMVLSETLRKYPVLDIFRKSVYDYKIPGTELLLPKGTQILISTRGIHNDPKYYPKPEIFDPERFSPDNIMLRHPCAWLSFGTGPRDCIGQRFARLEAKTGVAHFLKRFSVEPSMKTSRKLTFEARRLTLFVKGGTWLQVKPR